jgi:tellurite resistance protein
VKIGFVDEWSRQIKEWRNRPFLEAAMAAAALVASADQDVRLSEQLAVDELVVRLEELKVFEPRASADLHRDYVERLAEDPEDGRREALARVAEMRGDEHRSLLILYVAAMVAKADNELSQAERAVVEELCHTLGLPAEGALERIWPAVTSG